MHLIPHEAQLYFFKADGITPNSPLPVLLYRKLMSGNEADLASNLEDLFVSHNWTNNWRDTILTKNHYHSTTHEVLGIARGSVNLRLGGQKGRDLLVSEGDVMVIPAGVGHHSLGQDTDYQVVGGYPEGRNWNMIYDEPDKYETAKVEIDQIPIPKTDPVFGSSGPLTKHWHA